MISAVNTGTILVAYEVLQAHMNKGPIDIKDITAYMAGLGLYLYSEKIFQEYLQLKHEFKSKVSPFFRQRLGGIKQHYAKGMSVVNELMEDLELPQGEKQKIKIAHILLLSRYAKSSNSNYTKFTSNI